MSLVRAAVLGTEPRNFPSSSVPHSLCHTVEEHTLLVKSVTIVANGATARTCRLMVTNSSTPPGSADHLVHEVTFSAAGSQLWLPGIVLPSDWHLWFWTNAAHLTTFVSVYGFLFDGQADYDVIGG